LRAASLVSPLEGRPGQDVAGGHISPAWCTREMTANDDLAALTSRIRAIQAAERAPLRPGESRPIRPISESFTDEDWMVLTRLARALGREHRATLNRFLGEIGLASMIVGVIAGEETLGPTSAVQEEPETLADLAARIDERASPDVWLVAVPLANLVLPEPLIELDERCFLIRVDTSLEPERWMDADDPEFELERRLGDRLNVRPRWLRSSLHPHPLDTRIGAAAVMVVENTEAVAVQVAHARAAYIVAAWTLAEPPPRWRLWPVASVWTPQPFVRFSTPIKPYAGHSRSDQARRPRIGSIRQYREYELGENVELLRRPLRAIGAAGQRHSARALLSATWAWQHAARDATGLETTDLMLYAFTALAALCEDPRTRRDSRMFRRWETLQRNVPGLLENAHGAGLQQEAIDHARQMLHDVRNLAAHGSDAALINLGYPAEETRSFRRHDVPGTELALASLHAALRPSLWLLREALLHCWAVADKGDFDDEAFEALMEAR
jgi:hypothetical protein